MAMRGLPGALRGAAQRLAADAETASSLGPALATLGVGGSPARVVQTHPIVAAVASPVRQQQAQRPQADATQQQPNTGFRRDGSGAQQRVAWGSRSVTTPSESALVVPSPVPGDNCAKPLCCQTCQGACPALRDMQ